MSEFEQKVINLLEEINSKLDSLLKTEPPASNLTEGIPDSESGVVKPSELVEKLKEEESLEERPPVEGRRICPDCQGTSFNTVEDKSQVLHQMGGVKIYAKKYVCRNCGKEI
ncbi:MAG: hypothetical protein ACXADU_17940 [Promethearchaeota archaeon]|jgi:hypothetical protein